MLLGVLAGTAAAQAPAYRLITNPQESARDSATRLLALLAEGNIEAAAELSTAPKHRYAVLRDYREAVGGEEFKRVYGRYFEPGNRLLAEAAIGQRRLLIWELGQAYQYLAGQFFVEVEGKFLLDDVPSAERAQLQRVLQDYRRRTRFSE